MTSWYAKNAGQYAAITGSKTTACPVFKGSGYHVEGQMPVSFANLSGAIAAGTFNWFNQVNLLASGTTIALSDADLYNGVGRIIYFASNAPASGPVITLSGSTKFNQGATHIATFGNGTVDVLAIAITSTATSFGGAGTPVVEVLFESNITLS